MTYINFFRRLLNELATQGASNGGKPVAPLSDTRLLALFVGVLKEWNCDGFILWKRTSAEWLKKNIEGHTQKSIGRMMYEHVLAGGKIDQVRENREGYREIYEYHYDFRIQIDDRRIYIETTLDQTRMGPTLNVVSMHEA